MEKLIYLVWDRPSRDPGALRRRMLEDVAPGLAGLGPRGITVEVDDDDAQVPAGVPVPDDELPVRVAVSLWLDTLDRRGPYEEILSGVGIRHAGYLVTESLCSDYGTTPHFPDPRDWPAGTRSPGVVTLTVFSRNPRLDPAAFRGHWYGHQSPMSEAMQPRMRYVRNGVVHAVTDGAPPYDAIVEEAWPTVEDLTDPHRFFGARDDDSLAENIRVMLDSVGLLADMTTLRSFTMSEYLLSEPPSP